MTEGLLFKLIYSALQTSDVEIEIGYVTGQIRDLGHSDLTAIADAVADYITRHGYRLEKK